MTRFVVFTDHHGSMKSARKILRLAKEAEFTICAGDFTVFEENWEDAWRIIAGAGLPLYFVAGNHERDKTCKRVEAFFPGCQWIGSKVVQVGGVQLAGLDGTDDLSPHHEEDLEAAGTYLRLIRSQCDPSLPLIVVSHYPPAETACCGHEPIYEDGRFLGVAGGTPLGSVVVRRLVDALKPRLVICGHFHDRFGATDKIGQTSIINPGPNGMVVNVDSPGVA